MDLSNTAILILSLLVLLAVIAALFYIFRGTKTDHSKDQNKPYNWQPEQDYDVKFSDEGPISPPWPTLKQRNSTPQNPNER